MEKVFADKALPYKPKAFATAKELNLKIDKPYQCAPAPLPRRDSSDYESEGDSLIEEPFFEPPAPADTTGLN
ncbi:MAG: hypothetical protein H7Y12_13130 [Sphingobacteriaceae bacterium]|nr:hypothetical protein [Cytophagaceae bacterium]